MNATNDTSIEDRLSVIFDRQDALMRRYHDKASKTKSEYFPMWPIDMSSKSDQRACREAGLKAVEELFEALREFRNWKPHRDTDVPEFDRDAFVEEIVDALHYIFEMLVLVGVDSATLYDAYLAKNAKNHMRLDNGY